MSRVFATFFGVGLLPWAPGTWGAAAALPAGYAIHVAGGFPALAVAALLIFLLGWWATASATAGLPDCDLPEIVIDEVAGLWIALLPLSAGLWLADIDRWVFPWPGWVCAFVLFRLFDIWKPGPIGWADRLSSPLGVMLDDVLAGLAAAACLCVAAFLAHGVAGI